jgi:hypothetical protein
MAQFLFRFDRSFFWPAAGLTPETFLESLNLWMSHIIRLALAYGIHPAMPGLWMLVLLFRPG